VSLTTYAGLKAAALRWVKRSGGTTVDDAMDDLIDLAEARLNRALRVAEMEASATITLTSGVGDLPDDYLEWREVWSGTARLTYTTPGRAQSDYAYAAYTPGEFTIVGSNLYAYPVGSDPDITLKYYQTIPALSDSNTSNWLLTAHPDAYLFSVVSEANAFLLIPEGAALWAQRAANVIEEITAQDRGKRYANVAIMTRGIHP
jgi:hypothetical protein